MDKKGFLEPNLHVYGGDDNRMRVYYMERWPKKRREKTLEKKEILEKNLLNTVNCVHPKYIIT